MADYSDLNGNGNGRKTDFYRVFMMILSSLCVAGVGSLVGVFWGMWGDLTIIKATYAIQVPDLQKRLDKTDADLSGLRDLFYRDIYRRDLPK